jgi:transposase-like protein
MRFVQLDAHSEKVREGGVVVEEAVLWGVGIDAEGQRHVLGVSVERTEFAESMLRYQLRQLPTRRSHLPL